MLGGHCSLTNFCIILTITTFHSQSKDKTVSITVNSDRTAMHCYRVKELGKLSNVLKWNTMFPNILAVIVFILQGESDSSFRRPSLHSLDSNESQDSYRFARVRGQTITNQGSIKEYQSCDRLFTLLYRQDFSPPLGGCSILFMKYLGGAPTTLRRCGDTKTRTCGLRDTLTLHIVQVIE